MHETESIPKLAVPVRVRLDWEKKNVGTEQEHERATWGEFVLTLKDERHLNHNGLTLRISSGTTEVLYRYEGSWFQEEGQSMKDVAEEWVGKLITGQKGWKYLIERLSKDDKKALLIEALKIPRGEV